MDEISLPTNRSFGYLFFLVFLIAGGYFLIDGNLIASASFSFLAFFMLAVSLFRPSVLDPFNRYWMKFGFLLGRIVSPLVITVIYFVMIVPIGLLGRVAGRDELRLRAKGNTSFWVKRDHDRDRGQTISFRDQF